MKSLIVLFSLLSISCFGQEPEVAVELVAMKLMYRGYENVIALGVTNNDGAIPTVSCAKCDTVYWKESNYFVVVPGKDRFITLTISLVGTDTINVKQPIFKTYRTYRIYSLPDPTLFWGGAISGSKPSQSSRVVQAKYIPKDQIKASFLVKKWTISINGESASGTGSSLIDADELIKSAQEGDKVVFEVEATGPDGVLRELVGVFLL